MENENRIVLKPYQQEDASFLAGIFFNTIHIINAKDYSAQQIAAWAPPAALETEGWIKKWQKRSPLVAVLEHKIVGFAEFEASGHIDCFYCHHEYQGCGVGSFLLEEIERQAKKTQIKRIYVEVSITAKPFFEARGFRVVKEQLVEIRGVRLTNFVMEKITA
jgi:putative acetyltransferase